MLEKRAECDIVTFFLSDSIRCWNTWFKNSNIKDLREGFCRIRREEEKRSIIENPKNLKDLFRAFIPSAWGFSVFSYDWKFRKKKKMIRYFLNREKLKVFLSCKIKGGQKKYRLIKWKYHWNTKYHWNCVYTHWEFTN